MISSTRSHAQQMFAVVELRNAFCDFLSDDALITMGKVSRVWCIHAIKEIKGRLRTYVDREGFGSRKWRQLLGKVPLAKLDIRLFEALQAPCPFWPSHRVKDTHFLVLIPATVNETPLTLNYFRQLTTHAKREVRCTVRSDFYSGYCEHIGGGSYIEEAGEDLYYMNREESNARSAFV